MISSFLNVALLMSLVSMVIAQQGPNDPTNTSNDTNDKNSSTRTIIIIAAVIGTLILVGIICDLIIRYVKNMRKRVVDTEKTADHGNIAIAYGSPEELQKLQQQQQQQQQRNLQMQAY
ncbi:hypothetical protein BD408DRAFT_421613 [Parasitella parasitica]|nr:hypothetical protein BD408DRAFT_421613 [Parasitella parasitica]